MSDNPFYTVVYEKRFFINSSAFQAKSDEIAIQRMLDDLKRFNLPTGLLYRANGTRTPDFVYAHNCHHRDCDASNVFINSNTGRVLEFHTDW